MDPQGNRTGKYGGSVREAGGSLGALGASREEQWAREQDAKLIEQMAVQKKLEAEKKQKSAETHWTHQVI